MDKKELKGNMRKLLIQILRILDTSSANDLLYHTLNIVSLISTKFIGRIFGLWMWKRGKLQEAKIGVTKDISEECSEVNESNQASNVQKIASKSICEDELEKVCTQDSVYRGPHTPTRSLVDPDSRLSEAVEDSIPTRNPTFSSTTELVEDNDKKGSPKGILITRQDVLLEVRRDRSLNVPKSCNGVSLSSLPSLSRAESASEKVNKHFETAISIVNAQLMEKIKESQQRENFEDMERCEDAYRDYVYTAVSGVFCCVFFEDYVQSSLSIEVVISRVAYMIFESFILELIVLAVELSNGK
ncbi:hypothetical protein HDU83_007370 [Entophlyctis luteolus]|nr:hypothetical protein HDU83_007370 [Entophlyctis luteolus]